MDEVSNRPAHDKRPAPADEAVVVIDEQLLILMADVAAQALFGRPAPDLLGRSFPTFLPERSREGFAAQIRALAAAGSMPLALSDGALAGVCGGQRRRAVHATLRRANAYDATGARTVFVVSLHASDVDDVDVAPLMLPLFDRAPVAILATARRHRIVFANPACAQLFGVGEVASLLGRSASALLHPSSRPAFRRAVARTTPGKPQAVRAAIERANGERRRLEMSIVAVPEHGAGAVQMVISDVTEDECEAAMLQRSRQELRQLSASLVEAREEERRSIARELHDELGQKLTALKLELIGIARQADGPMSSWGRGFEATLQMIDDTVASVRRIASNLRPLMLDDLGLNAAIEWLAREAARRMGIEVTVRLGDSDPPLGPQAATAAYRIVQEALTNVARHARATDVNIETALQGGELVLTVQDNGVGLPGDGAIRDGTLGLVGIRERCLMLGGRMEIANAPGSGARLCVHLPLRSTTDRPPGGVPRSLERA